MKPKTYHGGYEICAALDYPLIDYCKITTFLNLVNAPMKINDRGVNTYCLTESQVKLVKNTLGELRRKLKEANAGKK